MTPFAPPAPSSLPGGEVLRIITRLNVGGPARHVLRIAAPLAARGWRTTLVTGSPDPGEGDLIDAARQQAEQLGTELVVLPGLVRAPSPLRDLACLRALTRLIVTRRPTVVHTHTAKAGVLGRWAAARAGRHGVHPARVHSYHGHVLSGYFGGLTSACYTRVERRLARDSDALVAVSAAVRDELLGRHGVGRPEQYHLVPPGIDALRTRPDPVAGARLRAELGLNPDDVLIGAVGRLADIKRPFDLLAAFERLAPRCPRAHLVLVGDGPLREAVRTRVASLPRSHWLPPRDELHDVYAALDLLALPSWREGLPQVVVEARAAGVPVVASAVGGVPELLRHDVDGLLLPPGDVAALVAALESLCHDAPRRARLGAAASAVDASEHTADAIAARLAELYDGLSLSRQAAARHPARSCTSSS